MPKRDKPRAPGVLEARSFGIEASTDQLRGPTCDNQHGYKWSNGLIGLSTRPDDCEVGYRSKTEEEKKFVITQH